MRRISQPGGQFLDAGVGQPAFRKRLAIQDLQRKQLVLVLFDERLERGDALFRLLEVEAGLQHFVGHALGDDEVGLLLDHLDDIAQLGRIQCLAGLILQVVLDTLDLFGCGGLRAAVAFDDGGFDNIGADSIEQARG